MQKRLTEQGLRFLEEGQFEKAGHILSLLITHFPENAEAHHMLGIIELEKGNYDQAYILVNTALDLDPANSMFFNTMGNIELHRNKIANAEAAFKNAVRNNDKKIEYQYNLANFYLSQSQYTNAIDHYYLILQNNPTHYLSIRGITVSYLYSGELEIALEHAEEWVKEYSEYDEPYYYLGLCLFALGDISGALAAYDKGLNIVPTNYEIMSGIGACYRMLGNLNIAETYLHNALGMEPHNPLAIYNLGCIHMENGDLDSAHNLFKNALNLDATYAEALCGLGTVASLRGNEQLAIQNYLDAQKLEPFNSLPQQLYAAALLRQQNFTLGWGAFNKTLTGHVVIKQITPWHGQQLSSKERLLIWIPKETADITQQILFASLLPDLQKLAPNIVLMCDPTLAPLFKISFPNISICSTLQLHAVGEQDINYQCPLSGLGVFLRNTTDDFLKMRESFLKAGNERVLYYRDKYKKLFPNRKLVGIAWKATKNNGAIDYSKSTQLHQWLKLLENSSVQFIAVQLGDCASELKQTNDSLQNKIYSDSETYKHEHIDLQELSAQLVALDAIVSVDNITAHLAGALGLHVITFVALQSEWYWFKEVSESLWYKNMLILHHKSGIQWTETIAKAVEYL